MYLIKQSYLIQEGWKYCFGKNRIRLVEVVEGIVIQDLQS